MNYTQFREAVKGFLMDASTEIEADLDTLFRLGELRIYREADLRLFRQHAYTALTEGDYWLQLPPDCQVVRDIRITGGAYLEYEAESFIREYWPDPAIKATPKYYSQWNMETVLLAPTPSENVQVELTYAYQPPGLSEAVTETWLSTYAEDLLLYAILLEASAYKQGMIPDGAAAQYRNHYSEALQRVMAQEQLNRNDEFKQRGSV